MNESRILVAGIGNIFLGDDGFGVEVVRRLSERPLPPGVRVVDFGIRGHDLTYALLEPYDRVILADASARGGKAGTIYLLEDQDVDAADASVPTHGMTPSRVLGAARAMGASLPKVWIVACEPATFGPAEVGHMGLSDVVAAAVGEAASLIERLLGQPMESRPHA